MTQYIWMLANEYTHGTKSLDECMNMFTDYHHDVINGLEVHCLDYTIANRLAKELIYE